MLKMNVYVAMETSRQQVLINQFSQSITVIFLKAMLNIAGTCTCFIMVQYNAKMCIVSGFVGN